MPKLRELMNRQDEKSCLRALAELSHAKSISLTLKSKIEGELKRLAGNGKSKDK